VELDQGENRMKKYAKKLAVFAVLLAMGLFVIQGSLVTVHASTPHTCSRLIEKGTGRHIPHECRHGDGSGGPANQGHQLSLDGGPVWPPMVPCEAFFDNCGNTCDCPFASWDCFWLSMLDQKTPGALNSSKVFSKASLHAVAQHGLFFHK
jgi:hypothetical protein